MPHSISQSTLYPPSYCIRISNRLIGFARSTREKPAPQNHPIIVGLGDQYIMTIGKMFACIQNHHKALIRTNPLMPLWHTQFRNHILLTRQSKCGFAHIHRRWRGPSGSVDIEHNICGTYCVVCFIEISVFLCICI